MRKPFDTDLRTLEKLSVLIHGAYASGKTYFQGDFLKWATQQGPVRFLNISGEDGYLSLAGLGLGKIGETVETYDDFIAALNDYGKQKVFGLAVDSLPAFHRMVLQKEIGEMRYPDPKVDGERAKMLWGQIKMATFRGVLRSRQAASFVVWVAAYDKSEDPISGQKTITPDLPGQQALACAGWFDVVTYLKIETLGPTAIKRSLFLTPNEKILTRQRFPTMITKEVGLPEGPGGWLAFYQTIQRVMGE